MYFPTEQEILRMPDCDYMNAIQKAFFRYRLQELQAQIKQNLDATAEHLKDLEEYADPIDRASAEENRSLELKARDRERKLLKKIESAIKKIDRDEYGYCEETGEPIGIARLLARPTATLCIEAQERHERKERLFNH